MPKQQIILGIETSCDETAAAVLKKQGDRITILSNVVASSADLQSKYGGIIPEQAAREQIKSIIPVISEAINNSQLTINDIDKVAVTQGPGLIGSLLVGVETAKVLSLIWKKPLIRVNHLMGHFYANWISTSSLRDHEVAEQSIKKIATSIASLPPRNDVFGVPIFPCIGLLVSGGHTDLILMKNHNSYKYLGGTRDDAAGECFDKCARLLGLPYPGGPEISKLAKNGSTKAFKLPRPMINSKDFDFSFSGLKTAVANLVISERWNELQYPEQIYNLCASIEQAIIEVLVKKTLLVTQEYKVEQIIIAGGVAANQKLTSDLRFEIKNSKLEIEVLVPPPYLCTDNAAMIASRAFFEKPIKNPLSLQANPSLSLS